jgi:hypothetical protein
MQLFNADPVRAYRVVLTPGRSFRLALVNGPFVIVGLTGAPANGAAASSRGSATVNGKPFTKKGDFLFLPAGAPGLTISNKTGTAEAQFAVFELY